jgi:hypothetical protein
MEAGLRLQRGCYKNRPWRQVEISERNRLPMVFHLLRWPRWIGGHIEKRRIKRHHRKRELRLQLRHRCLFFLLLRLQSRSLVQSIAIALIVVCLDEAEVGVPILRKWECIFARR